MPPPESNNQDLHEQLQQLHKESVVGGADATDQLDLEEYDKLSRADTHKAEQHWKRKVLPWLNWLKFGLIVVGVAVLGGAATLVLFSYLWGIWNDIDKAERVLVVVIQTVLISGTTLWVERLIFRR